MSQDLAKAASMIESVADDVYEGILDMDHPVVIDMMYRLKGAFRLEGLRYRINALPLSYSVGVRRP